MSYLIHKRGSGKGKGYTHVFSTNLPTGLILIQPLGGLIALITKPDDDVALDRPQRTDPRSARGIGHRPDRDAERRAGGSLAVIGQLTVVEVSLEEHQVGFREVEEEIGGFGVEVPVAEPGTPEGVLFVNLDDGTRYVSTDGACRVDKNDLPRYPAFRNPE